MALLCPACGTANSDTGRFCGNCATPLQPAAPVAPPPAVTAPPPAPVAPLPTPGAPPPAVTAPPPQGWPVAPPPATQAWAPPPGTPPPGWGQQPPGYPAGSTPPGYPAYPPAAAPARRLPVRLIVGGAVVVLAVLVVGGVAASTLLSKPAPPPVLPILSTPSPSPAVVGPSATPAASTGPIVTAPPVVIVTAPPVVIVTPGPAPTTGPTVEPTAGPQPTTPAGSEVVAVANVSVAVAAPWTVADTKDYTIQLVVPRKGGMALTSGTLKDPTTPEAWLQGVLADNQKVDPNAGYCQGTTGPEAVNVPNGPAGLIVAMCYTATPQGGQATKFVEIQMVAVDQAGTTLFIIDILASEANISEVLDAATPLLPTITWKLYRG